MFSLPKTIHKTHSPISGKIKVVQVGSERRLVVGRHTQSVNFDAADVGERIWGRIVKEIENWKLRIENCLILGLGGGTVAHLLTQRFGPIPIDGVELDPAIVEIGKKYFDLNKLANLNIITADAVDLVKNPRSSLLTIAWANAPDFSWGMKPTPEGCSSNCKEPRTLVRGDATPPYFLSVAKNTRFSSEARGSYSLIIVDLYCGGSYPQTAASDQFFAGLKALAHPTGVGATGLIIFNRVSTKDDAEFEQKLQKHFVGFQKTLVPSKFGGENIIYCGSPTSSKPKEAERR